MLPVLMLVMVDAWFSYMTTTYLQGHFGALTQSLGSLGQNVNQNVSAHVAGSAEHQFVVQIRLLMTAGIWGLALAGFARLLVQRRADVAMAVLGVTPFLLPVLQPYGGEMLLRVFLLALPAAAFFIARLAFPSAASGRGWPTAVAITVLSCILLGAFQFARYGNECLDAFTKGDVDAVRELYRAGTPQAPRSSAGTATSRGASSVTPTASTPLSKSSGMARRGSRPSRAAARASAPRRAPGRYLIVTRSASIEAARLYGKGNVLPRLVELLQTSRSARRLCGAPDGDIFFVRSAA